MTIDLKIAFLLFFFGTWAFLGMIPWLTMAIIQRGRGALLAFPLAIAGAWAAGVAVPLLGFDDVRGFFISLGAAVAGGAILSQVGFYLARSFDSHSQEEKDGRSITVHHVGPKAL